MLLLSLFPILFVVSRATLLNGPTGAVVGLSRWPFQHGRSMSSHEVAVHGQATTCFTFVTLSAGSILGTLVGTWAGIVLELDEGLF